MIKLPIPEQPPLAVLLSLAGSCGHTIDVRVTDDAADARAVATAMAAGESRARLTRFCPICMEDRDFLLPLDERDEPRLEPRTDPVLRHHTETESKLTFEVIPPVERAYQLWEGSREHEFDRAEAMLRNAADLFDRQGRFMERRGVLEELARRLADQGEDERAEEIRHQLKHGLM